MLPSKDAAGAADDPPLSAAEIAQAFEKAQEQEREREREEEQQEGDRGEEKDETSGGGLDLDRRRQEVGNRRGEGGGRWRQAFLRCFCGGYQ